MSASRRDFLKDTALAAVGAALPSLPASAVSVGMASTSKSGDGLPVGRPPADASAYTRGIGIYPGAAGENFSPNLTIDSSTYRNLALLRPAYHSSSYDYNLTAQLVTDGIKDTDLPGWIATFAGSRGRLTKNEREIFFDHFPTNTIELSGQHQSVQIYLGGGETLPAVDRIVVFAALPLHVSPDEVTSTVSVSDDGRVWHEMGTATAAQPLSPDGYPPDLARESQLFNLSIPLREICQKRYYQIECDIRDSPTEAPPISWRIGQVAFYHGPQRVEIGGPYSFTSAWMSAGLDEEWVYVDLGARCHFDRIKLYWIARAAESTIQISDDATSWQNLQSLPGGTGPIDDIRLLQATEARYVRVLMTRPSSPDGYILSEMEVYGRGGPIAHPHPMPVSRAVGRLDLAGGTWRLQRLSLVGAPGEALSKPGFKDNEWVVATVPGTVLTSYLNVEAIPDPNFGRNQLYISDSFFYSDFWYRTEFQAPDVDHEQVAWLNFDGVNWKAEIFLNGESVGRIDGGFMRGRFDVTSKLHPGQANALAVRIEKNDTPGSIKQHTFESSGKNGGALGADSPTYHASNGWDWIPTIRGRNTGIWGDVYLTVSGMVTIEDPCVTTRLPLPDTSRADVSVEVDVVNHRSKPIAGILRGRFGNVQFEQQVEVEGGSRQKVQLNPATHATLSLRDPKLWWPAGYGDPYLYEVELSFEIGDRKVLDKKAFKAGIRQMSYSEDGGKLKLWVNGRRFIARGGNWGFSESMLRYRAREYDATVRYHREMNFTMIRNWVGQIGDEAFYEACDRHGVMVWQDFWLANPSDGPNPANDALFLSNAKDLVRRIRNHACIGLYCGRNEAYPPKVLAEGIPKILAEFHPSIQYIPSSADDVVSGHGPYSVQPLTFYFRHAHPKLHSELGMTAIPPIESVRAMMPESSLWPQGLDWGLHDFCLNWPEEGAAYRSTIEESYGGADSAEEWVSLAQFVNYQGYRAMFEAQSKYRMGLLLWMSHSCWPSFMWQTYDYYLEPTSAYFGSKKGTEPLHIQWNPVTDEIEVVNYSAGNLQGLIAQVEVLNMDGTKMWTKTASLDSAEDSTSVCISMQYPAGLSAVHFLRLTLTRRDIVLSTNFYLRPTEEGNYRAIRLLPKARLRATTKSERQGNRWYLTTQLQNVSAYPALMVRLKALREKSGDRILPVIYNANYMSLMPGERQTVHTELQDVDTRGEKPRIAVGGFNVDPV